MLIDQHVANHDHLFVVEEFCSYGIPHSRRASFRFFSTKVAEGFAWAPAGLRVYCWLVVMRSHEIAHSRFGSFKEFNETG